MTEPTWISITQAALLLKKRYHKARDLVLQGRLGVTRVNLSGRIEVTPQFTKPLIETLGEHLESHAPAGRRHCSGNPHQRAAGLRADLWRVRTAPA